MNIGEAAKLSGVPAKMIRYYESVGLVPETKRTSGGYRMYGQGELRALQFIRRARGLGFSMEEIKKLLQLWKDRHRKSSHVKRLALDHIQELDKKIAALQQMRNTLQNLTGHCHGDQHPDCPIISTLAEDS